MSSRARALTRESPRSVTSKARRRQILGAALACFTAAGVEATTIGDIRARCGASVGSIYHHFGSKEELAVALYLEGLRSYQEGFLRELRRHEDAESGVRAVVGYHLRWVSEKASWARYLLYLREADLITSAEDAIGAMNEPFVAAMIRWLEPHVEEGHVARLPRDLYQPVLVGPLHQFSRQWLAGRTTSSMTEAQNVLAEAIWKALQGPLAVAPSG
ncbi:MAG TPA: TetR/AcrR family transcriptional regulator [Dehalococcoidia bacterium]